MAKLPEIVGRKGVKTIFQKSKIPEISLCSEILDAEGFKLISHMLAWDALKKRKIVWTKNCL